jgi:membrane protease YdiL (CAAX protease family)
VNAIVAPARGAGLKCALVVGGAGAISVWAVLPYALSLLPPDKQALMPPLPLLYAAQMAQGLVMFTLMAWAGLTLGRRVGLGAPWLSSWIGGAPRPERGFPWRDALLGAVGACAAVLLLHAAAQSWMPPAPNGVPTPSPLQGFFASFYGGIGEELQLRLFLMTVLTWAVLKLGRGRIGRAPALVAANVVAALLFGAGHLPAASQIWPLTFAVVAYVVAANASAGIIFGAIYARHGFEAAVATHFVADLGLHVVVPLFVTA